MKQILIILGLSVSIMSCRRALVVSDKNLAIDSGESPEELNYFRYDNSSHVPSKIAKTFDTLFPNAVSEEWQLDGEEEYMVTFREDGFFKTVTFSETGEWVLIITDLEEETIPSCILDLVTEEYIGSEIAYAEYLESPSVSSEYRIILTDTYFDSHGLYDDENEDEPEDEFLVTQVLFFDDDCNFLRSED